MRTRVFGIVALMLMCSRVLSAQDMTGDWQGTLVDPSGQHRVVLHLEKDGAAWKATAAFIDEMLDRGAAPGQFDSVTVAGTSVKLVVTATQVSYDGTMAADGNSLAGAWTHGQPIPMRFVRATPQTAWKDPAPHTVQFIPVDRDVQLEVLDWDGPSAAGARTLILIAGLGNTAHVFDAVAQKLSARYHVLGVTRRGFGASSAPASGYGADRLGDDVLAVIEALKITRPVLAGHSLGGEELSSIGSRFPEKVAGLIYLDAGYSYAFYSPDVAPFPEPPPTDALPPLPRAILTGTQRYTSVPVPILAIYAVPHDNGPAPVDAAARAFEEAQELKSAAQVNAFEKGLPTARVVRIPRADHYVFRSHEAEVLREIDAFIEGLK
jgi:non-heme chloroperoxidase